MYLEKQKLEFGLKMIRYKTLMEDLDTRGELTRLSCRRRWETRGNPFWIEILVEERRETKLLRTGNRRGNIRRLGVLGNGGGGEVEGKQIGDRYEKEMDERKK